MAELILVSTLAGLATGVGAIIVVMFGHPSRRILSAMLGLAAGLMLSISVFDLLPEASLLGNRHTTILGFILGAGLMGLLDIALPHLHIDQQAPEGGAVQDFQCDFAQPASLRRCGLLLAIGIALHNLPEGLAIGAGYMNSASLGATIAISLALHNVPEGIATAIPLHMGGMEKWKVVLLVTMAGLMTPLGTFLGAAILQVNANAVSLALALAAGAMIYIVSDELIPQSHEYHSHAANLGLVAGFVLGYVIG